MAVRRDADDVGPQPGPTGTSARTGIADLRQFLVGGWAIVRTIRNRRAGTLGRFEGVARFVPVSDGLAYREAGHLAIGDHEGPAEQSYRYDFPSAALANVRFRDGRPFHALDLSAGWARARHDCDADRYRARFRILSADAWCVVWRVDGPRKAMIVASRFIRRPVLTDGSVSSTRSTS